MFKLIGGLWRRECCGMVWCSVFNKERKFLIRSFYFSINRCILVSSNRIVEIFNSKPKLISIELIGGGWVGSDKV